MKDSTLMGFFPSIASPPNTQISTVNMLSSTTCDISKGKAIVETPSLSPSKALYHCIQSASDAYIDEHHLVASYPYHLPYWLDSPLLTLNYLLNNFPSDESIMEIMSSDESLWEDHHHRSSFLPNAISVEFDFVSFIIFDIVKHP